MGKVDDLRALREARYAAMQKAPSKSVERRLSRTGAGGHDAQRAGGSQPDLVTVAEELCGHQSIGKKRCIRPKDHPEKNHRYGPG